MEWIVDGTVTYSNSTVEAYNAKWPGMSISEADAQMDQLVTEYMRKRKVHGICVKAVAKLKGGQSILVRIQWKD